LSGQGTINIEQSDQVDFADGRITVSTGKISLIELMKIMGSRAGFKIISFGDVDIDTGPWSFSDLPLARAIEKVLDGTNAIIAYHDDDSSVHKPEISTVYILGSRNGESSPSQIVIFDTGLGSQVPDQSSEIATHQALTDELILEQTLSGKSQDRIDAIERLQGLSDELTMAHLRFALQHDPDPEVRIRAVSALEQIGGSTAATALQHGLGDDNSSVRINVVKTLGKTHDERVPLWLGQILMGDSNAEVRLQAVHTIANQEGDTARIFLEAAADDSSNQVSAAAVRLLGQ
jgi:hypothetical protein